LRKHGRPVDLKTLRQSVGDIHKRPAAPCDPPPTRQRAEAKAVIQQLERPSSLSARTGQARKTLAHYASQRPTILPKIGSEKGDANGSQLGSSAVSDKTDLTFRRSLLRARLTYCDWPCRVASAKT